MTADMDAVKSFNAELSSLYEVKPPISKAKMTALTRGAIKAIKFYKHVVQSVEKFILKCKPEYKVPGLYVIDSIVRQSRHQFGTDKDVFAPRFAKNMQQTFLNLFKCPPEDKSKIIRVLNLWQKNQVFAPDVVQPLFDLADPNHPIHKELLQQQNNGNTSANLKGSPALQKTPTKTSATDPAALAQLGSIANNTSTLDPNTLAQLQQLHRLLLRQQEASKPDGGQAVHFDRKLLDFDYGSDEDDDPTNPSPKPNANNTAIDSVGSLLSNPEVLRQLQTLQQSMITNQTTHTEYDIEKLRKLQEMKQQEDEFDKHLAQTLPNYYLPSGADLSQPPPGYKSTAQPYEVQGDDNAIESEVEFVGANDNDVEVIDIDHGDSRSPSRDRYNRRRRSRSRDRNRRRRSRSRSRRHRSRSRDRNRERGREKEEEKEKDKERRKRGLPPIKKDNLSVCSTTLWVGHLSKLVHQEDLSDTFGEFGEIVSIDLIIPRGCAFIVMHRRQDAARCLTKLKNHKMQGKAITLAWAPGKGVKGKELKDYWEGDLGVSYIPFSKIKPGIDIELLEDGGMVDEDTAPEWMKERMSQGAPKPEPTLDLTAINALNAVTAASFVQLPPDVPPTVDTSQPPPLPTQSLLQPPPMTMPLVSPFQLNNRLIGMPPGMMPNVPLGVPPPNLQGALLQNQLMGLGSPFGQGLLHPPIPMPPPLDKPTHEHMPALPEQLLPFNIMPPQPPPLSSLPHDENMDVEMEDANKHEDKPSNDYNSGRSRGHDDRDRSHRERNRSRDRDRDSSSRSNRRDRRDSRDNRDNNRSDRRDRPNRWGDNRSSRDSREVSRDDRREREKTLNDRLREMAGDNTFRDEKVTPPPLLERPPMFPDLDKPERFGRGRRHESNIEDFKPPTMDFKMKMPPRDFDGPPVEFEAPPPAFEPPPPREFDGPPPREFDGPPPRDFEGPPRKFDGPPPIDFQGPPMEFDRLPMKFEPPMHFEGPPRDFDGPPRNFDGPPRDFDGPPIDFDGPRDFDGPPREFDGPPIDFDGPPMDFDGPPMDFDGPPMDFDGPPMDFDGPPRNMMHPRDMMRDRFDDRRRGPPDFFPPRDGFGGPRGRFRGPDGFGPRHMMRGPMFHPRGPHHMRGPRPGPWMDGGMRPNFPPRFEPPPDFFRGPPVFEDSPHPRHNRRHEDRRRFGGNRNEFEQPELEEPPQQEFERPERRSRWGNNSPRDEVPMAMEEPSNEPSETIEPPGDHFEPPGTHFEPPGTHFEEPSAVEENVPDVIENPSEEHRGNTTPLHDEPQEAASNKQEASESVENEAEADA